MLALALALVSPLWALLMVLCVFWSLRLEMIINEITVVVKTPMKVTFVVGYLMYLYPTPSEERRLQPTIK